MKELWNRITYVHRIQRELILSSFIINLLALASSLYSIQVLNRYMALGITSTLVTLTTGVILAIFFEGILRDARLKIALWIAGNADQELSEKVFEASTMAKFALLEQLPVSARREIISGLSTVQQCFNGSNMVALLDAPFGILFLIVLAILSPFLAIVALILIISVSLLSMMTQRKIPQQMEDQTRISIQIAGYQNTLTSGTELIRAFEAKTPLKKYWEEYNAELSKVRKKINFLQHKIQNYGYSGGVLMGVLIIGLGAEQVLSGKLDVGVLVGASILATRSLASFTRLLSLAETLGRGQRSLELISQLCSIPKERIDGLKLSLYRGTVAFEDVAFAHFKQPTPVFERLNLKIDSGMVVCVIGDNGTGKTTFARLILGLLEPARGSVLADGMEIRQVEPNWWRSQIAYLSQEISFFDGTLRENLSLLRPNIGDDELLALCRELCIANFIEGSVDGLEMQVKNGGAQFPPGIKKRLALVRTLVSAAPVILLDEPTESVDLEGKKAISIVLNRLIAEKKTLIVISNESFIANAADLVIDLNVKPIPRVLHPKNRQIADQNSSLIG